MTDTKAQPEVVSPQQAAETFVKEYTALCEKHGMQIVVIPQYKSRDDGTFSTILATSVGKLPKQE